MAHFWDEAVCSRVGFKQCDESFPHPPSVGPRAKRAGTAGQLRVSTCGCTQPCPHSWFLRDSWEVP